MVNYNFSFHTFTANTGFTIFYISQPTQINHSGKHAYSNRQDHVNFVILPADYLTMKFILNSVEGSRTAPTRNQNLALS